MLTTQKTTRGIIITICNYDFYQNLKNYKNDTENESGTTQERHRNDTINKNDKNVKNENKIYIVWEKYKEIFKDFYKREPELTDKRRKHIKARLEKFTINELIEVLQKIRKSKYHCGENPSNKFYATPDYCFRNDEQTENWLNDKQQNKWDAVEEMIKKEKENG